MTHNEQRPGEGQEGNACQRSSYGRMDLPRSTFLARLPYMRFMPIWVSRWHVRRTILKRSRRELSDDKVRADADYMEDTTGVRPNWVIHLGVARRVPKRVRRC